MITVKEEFLTDAKTLKAIKLGGAEVVLLWLAMKRHAAEHLTDGFVADCEIESLPGAPRKVRKALQALVECGRTERNGKRGAGLVDKVDGGWQLHDYLDHSSSREEIELKREKARLKKRQQRNRLRQEIAALRESEGTVSPGDTPRDSRGDIDRDTPGESLGPSPNVSYAGARALPSPAQPSPEDPPTPFPDEPERTDPFAASLTGRQPHDRADVNRLHAEYKRVFGLPHRRWYSRTYPDARILADAIDAHGLEDCLLVVNEAPNDGMVSGRDDERRAKHESIGYIFDNASAFDRILRAAKKRPESGARKSISDQVADLKKLKVAQ